VTLTVVELAYAKVNLCLFLGPTRADGRHELVTLFDSVRLTDELIIAPSQTGADEVVCDGVSGPNLVANALRGLRAAGWSPPPLRVEIWKRIPVAAGMGGGSADAAAMLRCAPRMAPVEAGAVLRIAASLGADVPSQLVPGPSLGTGAGDLIEPVEGMDPYGVLVLPQPFALSTADVYREADRLGLGRSADELQALGAQVRDSFPGMLAPALAVNDLQPASLSLAPSLADVLEAALAAGADHAIVCGSGPTVIGVFYGERAGQRARRAAADEALQARFPGVVGASPVHSAQSGLRS
jgi:4-diphosphocytidyl-2-C-methyl-D-erythritol kinase